MIKCVIFDFGDTLVNTKIKTLVKQYWERLLPYFGKKAEFKD